MSIAAIIFFSSTVVFVGHALIVTLEERKARRFIGGPLRDRLDVHLSHVGHQFENHWKHVSRYLLQLGWYYSVHRILHTILGSLIFIYTFFEKIFERNRTRTKELRKEFKRQLHRKSHLGEIAKHKEETTLSAAEKTARRSKSLEQNH
jgi:hypothetical protein